MFGIQGRKKITTYKTVSTGCYGRENKCSDSSVVAGVCAYCKCKAKVRTAGKSKKYLYFLIVHV